MKKTAVCTSKEIRYVSATKINWLLLLFRETIAVYYENHMGHTNTLRKQDAEFQYVRVGGTQ
jgi:hypothetical protein